MSCWELPFSALQSPQVLHRLLAFSQPHGLRPSPSHVLPDLSHGFARQVSEQEARPEANLIGFCSISMVAFWSQGSLNEYGLATGLYRHYPPSDG